MSCSLKVVSRIYSRIEFNRQLSYPGLLEICAYTLPGGILSRKIKGSWLSHCQPVHTPGAIEQKECVNIVLQLPQVRFYRLNVALVNLLLRQTWSV